MAEKSKHPQFSEEKQCGHCGNKVPMLRVAHYADSINHLDEKTGQTWEESDCYELLKCPACNKIELRSYAWNDGMDPWDVVYKPLYPVASKIPLGLPPEIKKAYVETLKVRNVSANAYGGLIGRVVELVCEDRRASGKDLFNKLRDLADKGEIPSKLVAVADKLRIFRNVGAHAALGELTEKEVPILESLTCAILEYVYSAPFLAEQAKNALDHLKRRKRPPQTN